MYIFFQLPIFCSLLFAPDSVTNLSNPTFRLTCACNLSSSHRRILRHKDAFSTAAEQRHGHRDGHGVPMPSVSLKKQGTVPVSVTDFAKVKTALDSAMPSETYYSFLSFVCRCWEV